MGNNQVGFSWTAVSGSVAYELWHATDNPYFTPPATACDQNSSCTFVSDLATTHTGTGSNANSYLLRPVNHCGTVGSQLSNRTGTFHFDIVAGSSS